MKSKRGELATSTLIIIIATLLTISGFLFFYFSEVNSLSSDSYSNVKLAQTSITKGYAVIGVSAADGNDGYFTEFYVDSRLLPDSDEISFETMNIFVKSRIWSGSLSYRNGTLVQNDSGYVGYLNGSGYFQAQHLITSTFHRDDRLTRGETVRFYIHIPSPAFYDETVSFKLLNQNGISYSLSVFTGDTIPAKERIVLYPKI